MKKTVILFLALVISLSACGLKKETNTGKVLGIDEAKTKAESFINNNLLTPGNTATVKEINEEGGFYKLVLSINGQDYDSYLSKDGEKFMPQVIKVSEVEAQAAAQAQATTSAQTVEQPATTSYSEADNAEIATFVTCLAEKKVKIYGANWCGYTKALTVDTFGGFDKVQPIYVECTEQTEVCTNEKIEGYPTIKIDGQAYSGARSFEKLAEATGCAVPKVNAVADTAAAASCSGGK